MSTTKEKMIEIEKSVKDFQELEKKFLKSLKDKLEDMAKTLVQLLMSVPVTLIDKMYPEDRKFYFTNKGIKTEFYYDHD